MNKVYNRQNFVNGQEPALNDVHLNAIDKGLSDLDDRVIEIAGDVAEVVPEIDEKLEQVEADLTQAEALKTACQTSATAAAGSATEAKGYAQQAAAGSGGNALEYTNNVLKLKRDSTVLSQVTISGGSGGTTDYTQLSNKPSINSVTLSGNKTGADFNLANAADVTSAYSNIYGISNAYNASTSYAPDDAEKPSMCIDENELYKCLVACQGIKPSTDTSGSWERVSLESLENGKSGKFEIVNVVFSNSSAVTIAAGKGQSVAFTKSGTADLTNAICLGISHYNVAQSVLSVATLYYNNIYVRNNASSSVTVSANTMQIQSTWLKWL